MNGVLVDLLASFVLALVEIVNCMAVALILRGIWPDTWIDPCFRHVTYGLIISQMIGVSISGLPGGLIVSAFENLTIFSAVQKNIGVTMKGESVEDQVVTFFTCISVSCIISGCLLMCLSVPRMGKLLAALPDYVRHGVFAAVGIGVMKLGFESYDLQIFEMATWTSGGNLMKWCPAYILGAALWYIDEYYPSRWLLLGFIVFCISGVQIVLLVIGMSPQEAAEQSLLLGNVEPREFSEFFQLTYGNFRAVHWEVVLANLPDLAMASLVGPVLNVSINVIIVEQMCKVHDPLFKAPYAREFIAHSLGTLATAFGFGFNTYLAASDTSLMHKAGGRSGRPLVFMCAMLFLVCLIPPVLPMISLLVPILLPAALFVFIGLAVTLGCFNDMRTSLPLVEYSLSLMTCATCVMTSVPLGMFISCGVVVFQNMTKKDDESVQSEQ